ncbi:MAG TPA: HlyD family efflux transporter periplasmic adaptor subunit [Kofleriaceae bacterium]|nr:HlyD family efflux transporter periplasmic adaptor subunit [Kofleriaceae bacterium]
MTRLRYLFLALPLAGAAGWWLHQATPDVHADAAPALTARPDPLVAPGHVEPVHDPVKLAFEAQGRIAEILVEEGDAVTAGQVLARLDDRLARAQLAAAEAQLAQAQARELLARRGPRSEDIAAARADAEAATASASHRGAEQARSDQLGKVGALATTIVDADDAAARVATAQAAAATARFQSLAHGTRAEQIAEAAAATQLARAQLDAARVALSQTVLVAPSDGVILRRTGEVGALVTLTTPIPVLSMADLGQLELRAEIDEADLAHVAVGQPAFATADAFGDRKLAVRITRLTRELGRKTVRDDDPRARVDTRVLEVIARFDGAPGVALPLGLRMELHLAPAK